jgi:hypothetical protein
MRMNTAGRSQTTGAIEHLGFRDGGRNRADFQDVSVVRPCDSFSRS